MKRQLSRALALSALMVGVLFLTPTAAQVPENPAFDGPFPDGMRRVDPRIMEFMTISKGAKISDGLLKIYQKDESVYAELLPHHFGRPLLCPIAIAKGAGMGGMTLNFDEQWV